MVQLRRGNAEVEQNAIRTCKSLPFEHLVDIAEVALDRCDTLPYILEAVLRVFEAPPVVAST